MKEAIISNCRCHSQTQSIGDEGDATSRLVTGLLKNRITALGNELSKKDTIIDYLTKQLFLLREILIAIIPVAVMLVHLITETRQGKYRSAISRVI